jgi:hypothetical protein
MDCKDTGLAQQLLRAMAESYPKPVHFGYLGLALGANSGAVLRALRQLRLDGLISIDRSLANTDVPFGQTRLSAKGQAVAAGMAQTGDAAETLRHFDAVTLANLQQTRSGAKPQAGRTSPAAVRPMALPMQKAEQLLGTAAA